jgi:hypothetical protein
MSLSIYIRFLPLGSPGKFITPGHLDVLPRLRFANHSYQHIIADFPGPAIPSHQASNYLLSDNPARLATRRRRQLRLTGTTPASISSHPFMSVRILLNTSPRFALSVWRPQ